MRMGTNPAKAGIPAYSPQQLGIALIVYIPAMEGYFSQSLEIFKYQLDSLRAATSQKFDVLVFDNGSCPQVAAELQSMQGQGAIDWLLLSRHNMGKAGAWNWIFAAMPNELICYADSDVLFRPGWLQASQAVLKAFPQVGMLAAQPNYFDVLQGEGQAQRPLQSDPAYTFQEYRPAREITDEYCLGIGATQELAAPFYQQALPAITHRELGVQAVIGASHMQFIIPRAVARQVTPLPATRGLLRKETMSLDYKIDQLGYLHLSTTHPFVFHMGNTVSERLLDELRQITGAERTGQAGTHPAARPRSWGRRLLSRLANSPRWQPRLLRLYNLLFQALYSDKKTS